MNLTRKIRSKILRFCISLILLVGISNSLAFASNNQAMSFRIDRPCDGNSDKCAPSIYAEGVIALDTPEKFMAFVTRAKADKSNYLPKYPTVILISPGGSVLGGVRLGEAIRSHNFDTYAPYDGFCASACSLAFLGGVGRALDPESKFGIHQFSSGDKGGDESVTQITVVLLADYIERMGVNRMLLDYASLVPPSEMYWLSDKDRKDLRVDNSEPQVESWKLDSNAEGRTFARARAMFSGDTPIAGYVVARNGNKMYLYVGLEVPSVYQDRLYQFVSIMNSPDRKIDFILDGVYAAKSEYVTWSYADKMAYGVIEVPWPIFGILNNYDSIDIEFNVPQVLSDIDPTVSLSAKELYRLYPAISK